MQQCCTDPLRFNFHYWFWKDSSVPFISFTSTRVQILAMTMLFIEKKKSSFVPLSLTYTTPDTL
jgi:hypothetical protein